MTNGKEVIGSTAILETRAVVKLACLMSQPQLSEQVQRKLLDFERKRGKRTPRL